MSANIYYNEVEIKYHLYNSLFLTLPFDIIYKTGTLLPLLTEYCEKMYREGKSPRQILDNFFQEYFPEADSGQRLEILFNFVQYIERQVVLFDSVEDAAFDKINKKDESGTLSNFFKKAQNVKRAEALEEISGKFRLRVVLTAHPTQFYPGSVLGIITDLGRSIESNSINEVQNLLLQLGKTPFISKNKPTPYNEAISLIWFLENVFYPVISEIMIDFRDKLRETGLKFDNFQMIEIGFWPGGDRDGNPFVTSEMTIQVAERLRATLFRCYYRDIRKLRRKLTFKGVEERIIEIEKKIYNAAFLVEGEKYGRAEEMLEDISSLLAILERKHAGIFADLLEEFELKVKCFGFHFATMDIRQDSSPHSEVIERIKNYFDIEDIALLPQALSPEILNDDLHKDIIRSMYAIREIQARNGEKGCDRYIISHASHKDQILEVYGMAKYSAWFNDENVSLDIIPLFESIEDLENAPIILHELFTDRVYCKHLEFRQNRQTVMLGFSDGTKDGGYLTANWAIYEAKRAMTAKAEEFGIKIVFFDGRGGPPARGGGNTHKFYAGLGPEIESEEIQLTVQGQTISSNFGQIHSCKFNLEQLLTAGMQNDLFSGEENRLSPARSAFLKRMSELCRKRYLDLRNHPNFLKYLDEVGPLRYFSEANIGSRPAKRDKTGELTLNNLRAIPFVGAWSLMKQNVPGWYGVGTAINEMIEKGEEEKLKALYRESMFFRALLDNSMQSLSKTFFPLTKHLENHERFGDIWVMIKEEFDLTIKMILIVSDMSSLMESHPEIKQSIALREKIVLPLLTIQQFALQEINDGSSDRYEGDILRKLVVRSLFGIINATRNSA